MIVHFDATAEELRVEDPLRVSSVIETLMQAFRRGSHLIVINRPVVKFLIEQGGVSIIATSLLKRIGAQFTQTGGLIRSAPTVLSLRTGLCVRPAPPNAITISFSEFLTSSLEDPASLLLENAVNDGELLVFLLEEVARRAQIPRLSVKVLHGGGADALNQLDTSKNLAVLARI